MKNRELAELLMQYPDDEVFIVDADTGWQLPIAYAGYDKAEIHRQSPHGFDDTSVNQFYIVSNYDKVG